MAIHLIDLCMFCLNVIGEGNIIFSFSTDPAPKLPNLSRANGHFKTEIRIQFSQRISLRIDKKKIQNIVFSTYQRMEEDVTVN